MRKILVNPKIICLCGSTKFKDEFIEQNEIETLKGNIVLSVGLFGHADKKFKDIITPEVKDMLDQLHKRKIDLCDEILVINKNNYIGDSTRSEILYAIDNNKKIRYMEHYE